MGGGEVIHIHCLPISNFTCIHAEARTTKNPAGDCIAIFHLRPSSLKSFIFFIFLIFFRSTVSVRHSSVKIHGVSHTQTAKADLISAERGKKGKAAEVMR